MTTTAASTMLEDMLRAIERQDLPGIAALLHPDAVFACPFGPQGPTLTEGREAVVALLGGVFEHLFERAVFTLDRHYSCADPAFAIAEYHSQVRLRSGADYANRYVTVLELRDGLIVLFREYFNPLALISAGASPAEA